MIGARRLLATQAGAGAVVDSFDRADSTSTLGTADSGQTWTAYSGTWGISSNQAYLVSTTAQAFAGVNAGISDVDMSCNVTLSATLARADCGLVVRAIDNNNYILVVLNRLGGTGLGNSIQLFKRDAGSFVLLDSIGSEGHVNGATYAVRVILNGDSIDIYRDGSLRLSHTFSAANQTKYGTATIHGIRVNAGVGADDGGSRFDDFEVTAA